MGLFLAGCHAGTSADPRFSDLPGVGDTPLPETGATAGASTATPKTSASAPAPTASGSDAVATTPAVEAAVDDYQKSELLKVGETIDIVYHDLPTMEPGFEAPIKDDGSITLLFNKKFQAAGKTPGQLEKEIHDAYVPNIYRYMTVTVTHKELTRFYYVGGEVRAPGREPYTGRITLLRAIETAGDFTDFAKKTKVQVARPGVSKVLLIDCIKARTDPKLDIEIYPGDKIHVLRRLL